MGTFLETEKEKKSLLTFSGIVQDILCIRHSARYFVQIAKFSIMVLLGFGLDHALLWEAFLIFIGYLSACQPLPCRCQTPNFSSDNQIVSGTTDLKNKVRDDS